MNIKQLFQLQEQHIVINVLKIQPAANWEALLGAD